MITYESFAARPSAFTSLSGLPLTDFEALFQDFAAAYAQDRRHSLTRRGQKRRRAAGGGTPFSQDGRTRLLMALVFLRVYPTYEVLAFFFSLHKANAQRGVVDVLATLEAHTVFVCERPAEERQKLRSVQAVMDAFPDVRLVMDAKEQRIQRPGGEDDKGNSRQKPFYSGKKKAHTLKTQVAVAPDGSFQSVGKSVPGSVHDLTLLRRSGLLHRLPRAEGVMTDKGYDGIQRLDPKEPDKNGPPHPYHLPHKARRGHPPDRRAEGVQRPPVVVPDRGRAQPGADEPVSGVGADEPVSGVGADVPPRPRQAQRPDAGCGGLGQPPRRPEAAEVLPDDLNRRQRAHRDADTTATR